MPYAVVNALKMYYEVHTAQNQDFVRTFDPGVIYWGWALDPRFAVSHDVSPALGRLTLNILDWLAKGR
jgi:hypothetical protein